MKMMTMTPLPEEFICPLTKKILQDPMVSRYGTHFERHAIMEWFEEGNSVCPVTGNPLGPSNLVSDKTLQWKIRNWIKKNTSSTGNNSAPSQDKEAETEDFPILQGGSIGLTIAFTPKHFLCPLTKQCMKDPVTSHSSKGVFLSFERKAILKWLDENGDVCPITGNELTPSGLYPNNKLKFEISQWQLRNSDATPELQRLELEHKIYKNDTSKARRMTGNNNGVHICNMLHSLFDEKKNDGNDDEENKKSSNAIVTKKEKILSVLHKVAALQA